MNLDLIKKKLDTLSKQEKKGGYEDIKHHFWKPSIGKQVIRIVPSITNKEMPFYEMLFYYGIGKPVVASPINWGEKDPINEFAKQLRQTNDKENWRLSKKLEAKTRVFVPIIVRGEESLGVRLWEFGGMVYQDFLNMGADEEVGDFTDVLVGRDIKLTTVGPDVTGTSYNKTTISPSMKASPLSTDKKEVTTFLTVQPSPLDLYTKYSFEDVKNFLQEWLTPTDEEEKEEVVDKENVKKSTYKSPSSPPIPVTANKGASKFDSLFDDDEDAPQQDNEMYGK